MRSRQHREILGQENNDLMPEEVRVDALLNLLFTAAEGTRIPKDFPTRSFVGRKLLSTFSFDYRWLRCWRGFKPCSAWDQRLGFTSPDSGLDPLDGHLCIFCNKEHNRLKVLFWGCKSHLRGLCRIHRSCFFWLRRLMSKK
jgi:hypothetical protein